MAFALLIIGITLVVASVRGTHMSLISLIYGDFSGPGNFWYWIAALLVIGAIGYVDKLKPLSDGLLVVILLALVLGKGDPKKNPGGGFFQYVQDALKSTTSASAGSVSVGGSGISLPNDPGLPNLTGSTPSPGPNGSTIYTWPGGGKIRIDAH